MSTNPQQPLDEPAKRRTTLFDFDVPPGYLKDNEDGEGVIARTNNFGVIKTVSLKLLSPLEDKAAIARSKGEAIQLAFELAVQSISEVVSVDGQRYPIVGHDGSMNLLQNDLHPKIRTLIIEAYSDIATPSNGERVTFIKSRRVRL